MHTVHCTVTVACPSCRAHQGGAMQYTRHTDVMQRNVPGTQDGTIQCNVTGTYSIAKPGKGGARAHAKGRWTDAK